LDEYKEITETGKKGAADGGGSERKGNPGPEGGRDKIGFNLGQARGTIQRGRKGPFPAGKPHSETLGGNFGKKPFIFEAEPGVK